MKNRTTKHLDWSVLTELVDRMREDGNRLHLLVTIQAMLGLRVGDALNLTWRQLSGGEVVITEGKTGKLRKLMINDDLKERVDEEFAKRSKGVRVTDKVFVNKHKTGPITIGYVNKTLKKVFAKYGIDADQVSSHMFRKSFAYKVLEDGDFTEETIFKVSRLLNHSTIAMTMKYLLLHEREELEVYNSLKL